MDPQSLVQRFLPDVGLEPLADVYADIEIPPGHPDRPWLYLNMVGALDGAATMGGVSGGLGGAADREAFHRLRETCDAILVGAGTVRVEGYGPPRLDEPAVARRRARGLADRPTIVVISASLDLDPGARLFSASDPRPIVLTAEDGDPERRAALSEVADVVAVGTGRADLVAAMTALAQRGVSRLLCEGGPFLNRQLFEEGLVDELFLTLAPAIAGGAGPRIVDGTPAGGALRLALVALRHHGDELLLRYRLVPSDDV